jgi:glycosyltransferase involved in cell wall biosynthesis
MTVTVGIPTTGERPVLRRMVEAAIRSASLLSQDAEVLVVVNGSDEAPGLGRIDSPLLRVIHLAQRCTARARNTAIAQARHETVLLADDDVIVPDQWCRELGEALCDGDCPVATGRVRVSVRGPITSFLDYERTFNSQPPGHSDPGILVTANCGLRRDLLPPHIRFDENLAAGDDTDLGIQLWEAGIRFSLLSGATPVWHELPEEIQPNLLRALRYGNSTAVLSAKRGRARAFLAMFSSWYEAMMSSERGDFRAFSEFAWPNVQAAFIIYDFIFNSTYVTGCISALEATLGRPVIRLDRDRMTAAWQHASDRAAEQVSPLSVTDWHNLPRDYARLSTGTAERAKALDAAGPVIADLKAALREHAPLTLKLAPRSSAAVGSGGSLSVSGQAMTHGSAAKPRIMPEGPSRMVPPDVSNRLDHAIDDLRRRQGPIGEADIDSLAHTTGISFRTLCWLIERKSS